MLIDEKAMSLSVEDRAIIQRLTEEATRKFADREAALKYFIVEIRSKHPAIWQLMQLHSVG
jgi:hypothetical protein